MKVSQHKHRGSSDKKCEMKGPNSIPRCTYTIYGINIISISTARKWILTLPLHL